MRKINLIVFVLLIVFGCSKNRNDLEENFEAGPLALKSPPPPTYDEIQSMEVDESIKNEPQTSNLVLNQRLPKKIIYSAGIKYRVFDLKKSEESIRNLVKINGGYISKSEQNNVNGNLNSTLTIRVPVVKFQELIIGTEKESIYTDYKNIESDDISAEFYDNELRIKSKKEAFEKYLTLLKQAKNVTEVLAVEEQLRIIREEIESKEGRQKFINDQVTYSTINLHIYQVLPEENEPNLPIFTQIWEKIKGGSQFFVSVIVGIFYWIPFILVAILIYYIFKRWRRRKK